MDTVDDEVEAEIDDKKKVRKEEAFLFFFFLSLFH